MKKALISGITGQDGSYLAEFSSGRAIATEAGFAGQIVWGTSKPNGQPRRCLDVSRAKELFGFQAKHALRGGLKKTMQWFFANRNVLREVHF